MIKIHYTIHADVEIHEEDWEADYGIEAPEDPTTFANIDSFHMGGSFYSNSLESDIKEFFSIVVEYDGLNTVIKDAVDVARVIEVVVKL